MFSGPCEWARNPKLSASATATASPPPSAPCAALTASPTCPPASPAAPGRKALRPRRASLRSLTQVVYSGSKENGGIVIADCPVNCRWCKLFFFLELIRNALHSLIWEFKVRASQYFIVLSSAIARRAIKFNRGLFRRSDADCRLVCSIFKSHAGRIYLSSAAQKYHFYCHLTAVIAVCSISQSTSPSGLPSHVEKGK